MPGPDPPAALAHPAKPKPSPKPVAASATASDPPAIARALAKDLHDSKSRDVLDALRAMSDGQLDALEAVLASVLEKDRNAKQRFTLARSIRYIRAERKKLLEIVASPGFTVKNPPDTESPPQTLELKSGKTKIGDIVVRTKVDINYGSGGRPDGYTIAFVAAPGVTTATKRWLQFFWRQVIVTDAAGQAEIVRGYESHSATRRTYLLTVDANRPHWSTDGGAKESAYYEEDTTVQRGPNSLMLADPPSPFINSKLLARLGPVKVVSRFHAAAYLVDEMDVLCRIDVDLVWDISPDASSSMGYRVDNQTPSVSLAKIDELAGEHRLCLVKQVPEFDYFKSAAFPVPAPGDLFRRVDDRVNDDARITGWTLKQPHQSRYEAIAGVCGAGLLDDDVGPNSSITDANPKKPGLNFLSGTYKFAEESGEVVFLDAGNASVKLDMPKTRSGPLPTIAISLTPGAFEWGSPDAKFREVAYSLGVMRHEMRHATHCRMAIEWLRKWRDAMTLAPFNEWLRELKKHNQINQMDYNIVSMTWAPFDRTTSEMLSFTEDFVTALQFDFAEPDFNLLAPEEIWPPAILALRFMFKYRTTGTVAGAPDTIAAVSDRMKDVICGIMPKARRDVLSKWLDKIEKPDSFLSVPPTPAQKNTLDNFKKSFLSTDMLSEVRAVIAACPP